ncbi:MAG: hypothetical protein QHH14_13750 [Clostridiales bacterium]|nr:hypothetical protein [Clostridiales bacterium]
MPHIPDGLNTLILCCLQKEAAKRYQAAEELVAGLSAVEQGLPLTDRILTRAKTKIRASREITVKLAPRKFIIPAIAALVIVSAAVIFFLTRGPQYDPKRIIITPFENQTGDRSFDSLGRMISERITQVLISSGIATVVQLPQSEETSKPPKPEFVRAAARESGAGTHVSGSFYAQQRAITIQAGVSNIRAGRLVKTIGPVSAPQEEPGKAVEEISQKVAGALAMVFDQRFVSQTESGHLPTFEAYRAFAQGQELFHRFEFQKAMPYFLKSLELDPDFKSPLISIIMGYYNQGHMEKAEEFAREAEKSREKLAKIDQLKLDMIISDLRGDWAGDLKATREAARLYGAGSMIFNWALAALNSNLPREALEALSKLDPERIWMKDWWGYWEVMTGAYHMLGEHKKELQAARRGRQQYSGVMLVLYFEAYALAALGRTAELEKLIDESYGLAPQGSFPGDFFVPIPEGGLNSAYVMIRSAEFLRARGYKEQSQKLLGRAIEWLEARPQQEKETPYSRSQQALAMYDSENWEGALALYSELAKEAPENIGYTRYLGCLAARLGIRQEALRIAKQLEELKRPYLFGQHTYARACIASLLGEKETALRLFREATAQGIPYWDYFYRDMDIEPLRDYLPFKEFIKPKG